MAQKFKFMPSCKMNYVQQGVVYFTCQNFRAQPQEKKDLIRDIAREASDGDRGKEKAIFTFMTTHMTWRECCDRYYLSDATLDRLRRKFYARWKERWT